MFKIIYSCLVLIGLMSSIAQAGTAFGDPYGNTLYKFIDKTSDCGYTSALENSSIHLQSSPSDFIMTIPSDGGYMGYQYYFPVMQYGKVSATTEGVSRYYLSPYKFQSRESHRPPYSEDGPITLTEDFFIIDHLGLLTHTRQVNGVQTKRCRYQRL
jgi:hypothetical protein